MTVKPNTRFSRRKAILGTAGLAMAAVAACSALVLQDDGVPAKPVSASAAWSPDAAAEPQSAVSPPAGADKTGPSQPSAAKEVRKDLTLAKPKVGDRRYPTVDVTITNRSSKVSDYKITVEFRDQAGKLIDTGVLFEPAVAPGDSVDHEAIAFTAAPSGDVTAKVVSVERVDSLGA